MPRRRPIRVSVLAELADTLTRRPRSEALAAARAAEALAADIDPGELYPEDWLAFRLTGREPTITEPRLVAGAALLADLSAVVERLTDAARAAPADAAPGSLTHDELLARWRISAKTLHRLRGDGLTAWVVREPGRRPRVAYTRGAIERFEARHADRMAKAASFARAGGDRSRQIAEAAAELRATTGCSLNAAAGELSPRFGMSLEGLRQLLRRHDADAVREGRSPLFPEPGPPTPRQQRALARLAARGLDPGELADATGRTAGSVRRAILEGRADLLRRCAPTADAHGTDARADRAALASAAATRGLGLPGRTDAAALLAEARRGVSPPASDERDRVHAMHALHARAASAIAALPASGVTGPAVDAAETDLRWASLLKAALLAPLLGVLVRTIESRAHAPAESLPAGVLASAMRRALVAASHAADAFDPAHGSRLAARVGIAADRALAGVLRPAHTPSAPGRAARTLAAGALTWRDWTLDLDPWQRWLAIDPRVRDAAAALPPPQRTALERRFGLDGSPPEALEALARRLGLPVMHAARLERRAIRAALTLHHATAGAAGPAGPVPSSE